MRFLMLVCSDDSAPTPEDPAEYSPAAWVEEMDGRGIRIDGDRLADPGDARTVRVRGGRVGITDGPFAETKEAIAGFDVLECASLEEAVEVASKHPMARFGTIEVRAFWGS